MSATANAQIEANWNPHPGQQKVLDSDARFRIVACGRRWGKTKLAAHEIFEETFNGDDPLNWWVAPSYRIADTGFKMVKGLIPEGWIKDGGVTHSKPKSIELSEEAGGGTIEFRSTSKEDGLRGEGVDFVVIDEGDMTSKRAWTEEIRPTLSDTMGDMLAISTPKGRHGWFYDYFKRGQSEEAQYNDVDSWQAPTYENPHVPDSEIDAAQDELPDRVFRQEYMAEFIDDSGGVFEKVEDRIVEDYVLDDVIGKPPYYIGVDFARHQDWTVITVLDADGRLVEFKRLRNKAWSQIQSTVERVYDQYPGTAYLDGSRDNKIVADLEAAGVDVEPVTFTSQRKTQMIENLITVLEKEEISIPDIPQMISELQMMEYDVTRAGNVRYHAPEGFHDDCVDSLALANWARTGGGKKTVTHRSKTANVSKGSWLS